MASMGFSVDTVQDLMTLVDDHKHEIKEQSYLKICNAIQFLHRQQTRLQAPPPQPPTPTSTPTLIEIDVPPLIRSDTRFFDPWAQHEGVQLLRHQLQNDRTETRQLELQLETTRPGNVRLEDKYKILITLYGYSGPYRYMDVTAFAKQLQRDRILTATRFKELCLDAKMARYTHQVSQLQSALNELRERVAHTRQQLVRVITNN